MFANLCSSASSESPHVIMNKFFALQHLMDQPYPSSSSSSESSEKPSAKKTGLIITTSSGNNKTNKITTSSSSSSSKSPKPTASSELLQETEKLEWAKGDGLKETKEVREILHSETRSWFLKYLDKTLDTWFSMASSSSTTTNNKEFAEEKEEEHIALTLSHLKHANEWLEKLRINNSEEDSDGTIDRLKHKVYSCLLLHVDSAASALERRR